MLYSASACGGVAQLGERDNRTVEVRGSSPLTSTKRTFHGAIAQLGERDTGSVEVRGSNPLGSTTRIDATLYAWRLFVFRGVIF